MPIRMSGLVSNMDTESIVTELMKAERTKETKLKNKITTIQWKQDKWKALNTKLYAFYTGSLSKMKMQGNFITKKTSSSNTDKLEVSASTLAPEGTSSVQIQQLASAQYVTGSVLGLDDNSQTITANTKLSDLGFDITQGTTIKISEGSKEVNLDIGASTTVYDFVTACNNAGLYATYDTNQKRFFISSKQSGNANSFSITTSSTDYAQDRNAIRDYIGYSNMSSGTKSKVDSALSAYINDISTSDDKAAARTDILTAADEQVRIKYINDYITNQSNIDAATASERTRLEAGLQDGETLSQTTLDAAVKTKLLKDANTAADTEYNAWKDGTASDTNVFKVCETGVDSLLATYAADTGASVTQTNSLSTLGLSEITRTTNADGTYSVSVGTGVTLVQAQDSKMTYNGADITGTSNMITANGITFTLKGVTTGTESISVGVTKDVDTIYNSIKDFVKSYNEILKEMNEDYDAASARGYDPLTDDQKESMTDDQIKEWEDKIKTSLLRRDDTLNDLITSMRSEMSNNVQINGKNYSLSNFGISTSIYTEKGLLHIQGDSDDSSVSGMDNKLKEALENDPEKVATVMTTLAGNLYSKFQEDIKSSTLNSALTFYHDKEMKNTLNDYNDDLDTMEDKLQDMEDRYYKQFSAMETAMAKMNSQQSALSSMLGTNS